MKPVRRSQREFQDLQSRHRWISGFIEITEVPRTMSGKKLEVPVKKLLLGGDPAKVVNRDSMANPDSFDFFVRYAKDRST